MKKDKSISAEAVELRRSRAELEAWLERYTELYDFAPVGFRGGAA